MTSTSVTIAVAAASNAQSGVDNIVNGTTAVKKLQTSHITVAADNIDIGTGGTFTVDSNNFNIDSSGNVTIKGTLKSGSDLGGWEISPSWLWNKGEATDGFTLVGYGAEGTSSPDGRYKYVRNYFMYCGADYPDEPHPNSESGYAPLRIVRKFTRYSNWAAGTVETRYTCIGNQNYKIQYQTGGTYSWIPNTSNPGAEGYIWVWAPGTLYDGTAPAHGWRQLDRSRLPYLDNNGNTWTWGSAFESGADAYVDP